MTDDDRAARRCPDVRAVGRSDPGVRVARSRGDRDDDLPGRARRRERVPDHTHDHEEVSQLLSGGWTVTIDGEDSELRPGDTAVIRAGVVHASFTLEGDEAVILTSMPVGTLLIRADGERVAPPWSE
jgi:mannose-6-phosphate isomerase-like protein (cupin superfamily)